MDFIGTCWEDGTRRVRRLLQPENSQAWKQLCNPVPEHKAVGRTVVLHGEIHGGSRTEELKKCGMLCQVKLRRPGHAGEGVVQEKSTPLGAGRAVFCSWCGWDWFGGGQGRTARAGAVPESCLCWITPPFPRERLSKAGFIRAGSLELLPALIQSRWTLSFGAGGGGQSRAWARSAAPGKPDREGGNNNTSRTAAPSASTGPSREPSGLSPESLALQEQHGQGLGQAHLCSSSEPPAAPRRSQHLCSLLVLLFLPLWDLNLCDLSLFCVLDHPWLQLQGCGQAGLSSPDSSAAAAGDIPGCVLDLLGAVPLLCHSPFDLPLPHVGFTAEIWLLELLLF